MFNPNSHTPDGPHPLAEALFQIWLHKKGLPPPTRNPVTGGLLVSEADFLLFMTEFKEGKIPVEAFLDELQGLMTFDDCFERYKHELPEDVREMVEEATPAERARIERRLEDLYAKEGGLFVKFTHQQA